MKAGDVSLEIGSVGDWARLVVGVEVAWPLVRSKEDFVDRFGHDVQKASLLLGRLGLGSSETSLYVHDPLENFADGNFGLDVPTQRASGPK